MVVNLALLVLLTKGPRTGLESSAARLKPEFRLTLGGNKRFGSRGSGRSMMDESEIEEMDSESSNPISPLSSASGSGID
jgi:hypothetical protein